MKKLLAITLSTLLTLTLFTACTAEKVETPNTSTTENAKTTTQKENTTLQEYTTWDDRTPTTPTNDSPATTITEENAKSVVLTHAGLKESEIKYYRAELDRERNSLVYEIEFNTDKYEYDYEVNAESGKIIKAEKEFRD